MVSVPFSRNYTLRFMPIPMYDASQALKTNPEKTEEALQKVLRTGRVVVACSYESRHWIGSGRGVTGAH